MFFLFQDESSNNEAKKGYVTKMKMIFKVADNQNVVEQHAKLNEPRNDEENAIDVMEETSYKPTTNEPETTRYPISFFKTKMQRPQNVYVYRPSDLIELSSV